MRLYFRYEPSVILWWRLFFTSKGKIISKWFFGVFKFPPKNEQKQVDLRYHSSKVEFLRSFFWRKSKTSKPLSKLTDLYKRWKREGVRGLNSAILRDNVVYGRPLRLAPDWYLENKKKRPLAVSFFHCWNNQIVFFKWLGSCFRHIITVLHAWFSHFPSR